MAKWKYVGPLYAKGVILRDNTIIFPESLTDDDHIDSILTKYPELAPYWRDATNDTSGGNGEYVPLGWWDITPLSLQTILDAATAQIIP